MLCKINQSIFLERHNFTKEDYDKTGLDWNLLEEIYAQHKSMHSELQTTADSISERLRQIPKVHSLKVRIKDPNHLIAKIIRKKIEVPAVIYNLTNYKEQITDLIGIRALHLFKYDWREIHDFILTNWNLREKPTANVREGDLPQLLCDFENAGCTIKKHPFGYRSIHYLIETTPTKNTYIAELQVRTIFEEGWSEIDHQIRYPRQSDDPYLAEFLTIFNRLAGSADEMGTFIKGLSGHIRNLSEKLRDNEKEITHHKDELNKAVSQLKIGDTQKAELQKRIDELQKTSQRYDHLVMRASGAILSTSGISMAGYSGYQSNKRFKLCLRCNKTHLLLDSTDWAVAALDDNLCPECRGKK